MFSVVIIGGHDAVASALLETGKQVLDVVRGCFDSINCISVTATTLTVVIPGLAIYRSARIITKIGRFIARSVNLAANGIGLFP